MLLGIEIELKKELRKAEYGEGRREKAKLLKMQQAEFTDLTGNEDEDGKRRCLAVQKYKINYPKAYLGHATCSRSNHYKIYF